MDGSTSRQQWQFYTSFFHSIDSEKYNVYRQELTEIESENQYFLMGYLNSY